MEEEMISFWETNDSADFWDDMEEVDVEVDLVKSPLATKPTILAFRPDRCPRCRDKIQDVTIEYLVDDSGRLLMIRDLPALRCEQDHLFIVEETFDKLQPLIALEKLH